MDRNTGNGAEGRRGAFCAKNKGYALRFKYYIDNASILTYLLKTSMAAERGKFTLQNLRGGKWLYTYSILTLRAIENKRVQYCNEPG